MLGHSAISEVPISAIATTENVDPVQPPTINPGYGVIYIRLQGGADARRLRWRGK